VITGLPRRTDLTRILDDNLDPIEPPETGLLVSERVAWLLHLKVGDMVEIVLLERDRRTVEIPVTSIIQSYIGLAVYMQADALDRLIADGPRVSGARISIDTDRLDDFNAIIRHTPAVNGIARQDLSRIRFRETVEHNITIMTTVYTALAVIVTFGVIYNSARIQLSERARELASLRVLGFTRAEVSNVLLLELGIITAMAQPLGWLFGYLFSWWVMKGFDSDLFRVPFVINQSTFAIASLIVLTAAVLSALVVRRRVDRLDLVRVLKTRE
jgi:putative ABC transport system permease protein